MKPGGIKESHYQDMGQIQQAAAQRKLAKDRKKRAKARAARAPDAIKRIDLQLYRTEFLKMAAQITDGPGELFKKFVAIAEPAAIITDRLCARKNWRIGRPYHWADRCEFLTFFGFPGDPSMCVEPCGLKGHLFASDSDHASANLIDYIDQWTAELEGQRAAIIDDATETVDPGGATGAFQRFPPNWG